MTFEVLLRMITGHILGRTVCIKAWRCDSIYFIWETMFVMVGVIRVWRDCGVSKR